MTKTRNISDLGAFTPSGAGGVQRTVENKLRDVVSVKDFGAVGDGVADDTAAVIAANAASKYLLFPSGGNYCLMNWEPLADTVVVAHGATISRFDNTVFQTTGACGALVVTNDRITVQGGIWTRKSGVSSATWSTAILVNGGDDFTVSEATFTDTWGAISGPELQNGAVLSQNFSILNCIFKSNSHNTYLTDIDGLTFSGNRSYLSVRDGLRLFRNCKNCIITDNILWDNGNGDVGQSMDGMDLFVAGDTCIIANNVIYGNDALGIDIKLSQDPAFVGETVRDQRYIISNNIIFSNAAQGIRINASNAGETRYVDNIVISNNLIYSNSSYGIWVFRGRYCNISDNVVHSNGDTGIRVQQSIEATVQGNITYNNSTTGIIVINDCNTVTVTGNHAIGGGSQTSTGIYVSGTSVRCMDNQSSGHTTNYFAEGQASVLGKLIDVPFSNTTGSQFVAVMPRGSISGLETSFNNTVTAADITVAKRNPTTGAALHTLCNDLAVAQGTVYVKATRTLNTAGAFRSTSGGEAILLSLANITSSFTTGRLLIHYID
jgi:parallel beta-helix repeat protein